MSKSNFDDAALGALEQALGYGFANRNRLRRALTHASATGVARENNQRLEFLGDRVLGLLTAEALLRHRADESEGRLAPRLNALVRGEACAEVAREIGLGERMRLSRAEANTGGRRKTAVLGDAMEAVIAAVYLDGGLEAARGVFEKHWRARMEAQDDAPIDAKTALQEWAQARGLPTPSYKLVNRSGPDHAPQFTVSVELSTGARAEGAGPAKRSAEQQAARCLFEELASNNV